MNNTQAPPIAEEPDLMTCRRVAALLDCSVRTVWRMVQLGQFPSPIRLNSKFVRWRRTDVRAWIDAQQPQDSHRR